MQTLYIDVYFLINFTVDFIALYFAAVFSKVPTTAPRLLIGSAVGGVISCIIVLLSEMLILNILLSFIGLPLIIALSTRRVSLRRRIRCALAFLVFGALIGAGVNFFYGILDELVYELLKTSGEGTVNRKMLFFAIIVLISMGVFKMLITLFNNTESERSLEIEIILFDKTVRAEAFVDSGNLAIDPMDMRPILFVKADFAGCFLPEGVVMMEDPDKLDAAMRRRIRLIPISRGDKTQVLVGVRPDGVNLIRRDGVKQPVDLTVAIDKEDGTFGGFYALIPSSVVGSCG